MLVIAIIGHSKQREVVHSTTIREGSTVEMAHKKGSLGVAIILLCVCMYLGMLRWFTHFCTGKCIRMCSLHGCGTELIVYCSVSLSGIAIYIGTDMCYSFVGSKDMYCKWNVQYKHSCKTVQLVIMELKVLKYAPPKTRTPVP